uniref:Uncharacterized protein n=1 Tax=viral metagenome TaxID=1070528 RepID=A0A6M3IIC8_9ZZZZ
MKVETLTFEYDHCGECPYISSPKYMKWKCLKKRRIVPEIWGKIPDWCPLPDKEEVK